MFSDQLKQKGFKMKLLICASLVVFVAGCGNYNDCESCTSQPLCCFAIPRHQSNPVCVTKKEAKVFGKFEFTINKKAQCIKMATYNQGKIFLKIYCSIFIIIFFSQSQRQKNREQLFRTKHPTSQSPRLSQSKR